MFSEGLAGHVQEIRQARFIKIVPALEGIKVAPSHVGNVHLVYYGVRSRSLSWVTLKFRP